MGKKKPRKVNKNKTAPRTLKAKLKAAQALELRCEGKSFPEIAKELGYKSRQAAWKACMDAIDEHVAEPAERCRTIELIRLDKISEVTYLQAQTGDNFAINSYLAIHDRRCRLLGLLAPQKHELTGKDGEPLNSAPPVLQVIIDAEPDQPTSAPEAREGVPESRH